MDNDWEIKNFIEYLVNRVSFEYASKFNVFVEEALRKKRIDRMIVWAFHKKYFFIAKLLSKTVGLKVEIEKSNIDMREHWRVIYANKCISKATYDTIINITS